MHLHLIANENKPICTTCETELAVNHILTDWLQYIVELNNLNIPNTLDTALGPNADTIN